MKKAYKNEPRVSGTVSTGQDEFVAPPEACRSGEQTLSVQRQAVEHLSEI
jgi:hypothetical protein